MVIGGFSGHGASFGFCIRRSDGAPGHAFLAVEPPIVAITRPRRIRGYP